MANPNMDNANDTFPLISLIPKKETGALNFINRNPNFDGRGVKVAIFDTGIDPGAPGLSVTSDGKPKIIHMHDATGAGDVDTSQKVTKDAQNNHIIGLTGRILKIPDSWPAALNNEYHIGIKAGYELYPKPLKSRIVKLYSEQNIDPNINNVRALTLSQMNEFKENQEREKSEEKSNHDKLLAEEFHSRQNLVDSLQKIVKDLGPAYDVICYNNGENWKVCIDTSETGDLASCTLLNPYSLKQEFATLTKIDRCNYAVNVQNDGNLVEIVTPSCPHGTHVASIAASNFPDEPERNGIAPGAQIISIMIGDMRLGTMETGTAIVRALSKAVELGADIINMSYGEPGIWNSGRVFDVFGEAISKYGIIHLNAAGNEGPALSTVGQPATYAKYDLISVGAYSAPELMTSGYSMREKLPSISYNWTSRGPTIDGALGVTISTPGGAIASVPNYLLRNNALFNGTSMACPNAAGCVALLLSGLKQKSIPYSPFSIKRGLENTAWRPSHYDPFAMGAGVVSVEKAFEFIEAHSQSIDRDVHFQVKVNCKDMTGLDNKLGIYLRQPRESQIPTIHTITIKPVFLNNFDSHPIAANCSDVSNNQRNIDFILNLVLVCDASYISLPSYLSMCYDLKSFEVRIDPTGLPTGVHYSPSIRAYDAYDQEKKIVFEVPITIIRPQQVIDKIDWKIDFPEMTLRPDMEQPLIFHSSPRWKYFGSF